MVVISDEVEDVLALYFFELCIVVEEIIVTTIDSVYKLLKEVVRNDNLIEKLRGFDFQCRLRNDCYFLLIEEGNNTLMNVYLIAIDNVD